MNNEIERKWLILRPSEDVLGQMESKEIYQIYLPAPIGWDERRVRKSGSAQNGFVYTETKKRKKTAESRDEDEKEITEEEYNKLSTSGLSMVHKTRYVFKYENQNFELDVYFDNGCVGQVKAFEAILELELAIEGQVVHLPWWLQIICEVTDNPSYKNKNLSRPISDNLA